jgi:hypothetical protein
VVSFTTDAYFLLLAFRPWLLAFSSPISFSTLFFIPLAYFKSFLTIVVTWFNLSSLLLLIHATRSGVYIIPLTKSSVNSWHWLPSYDEWNPLVWILREKYNDTHCLPVYFFSVFKLLGFIHCRPIHIFPHRWYPLRFVWHPSMHLLYGSIHVRFEAGLEHRAIL